MRYKNERFNGSGRKLVRAEHYHTRPRRRLPEHGDPAVRCRDPPGFVESRAAVAERLRQPLVVGGLVVALGRDADQDPRRRRPSSLGRPDRPGRSGPGSGPRSRPRRAPSPPPRPATPASGSAAIEPSIASGAGGVDPERRRRRSRPSRASAWFAAMIAGQPPSGPRARHPVDRGGQREEPVGSAVPTQSNSSRKRAGPRAASLAPCEMTSGWIRRGGRRGPTGRRCPSARTATCARCPVQYAAPSASSVERHHARRVGAVDERVDAAPLELGDELARRAG